MYSNNYMIRVLSPLLEDDANPLDSDIKIFRRRAESKINLWLSSRYTTPLTPKAYPSGTITVQAGNATITGSGTSFTDLYACQTIQLVKTREVLQIKSIESDTEITANSEALTDVSDSAYWVLPDEIVTASEFLTAYLLILTCFAEKAGNQKEVELYYEKFKICAKSIIDELKKGKYLNTDLEGQDEDKSSERLIKISTGDIRTKVDNNQSIICSSVFGK